MSEDTNLPAAKWWQIPEQAGCVVAVAFVGLGHAVTLINDTLAIPYQSFLPFTALLGIGVIRYAGYSTPDLRFRTYLNIYQGIYFGLFWTSFQLGPDAGWGVFVLTFLIAGTLFGGFMYGLTRPYPVKYDWTQIYLDQSLTGFTAKRVKYWPFVTLTAIFATLALTRSPAWAILTGAAFLAFTPPAYARNPATARPVLARLLNLLAVCLIFIAAASLILKGY